jgi:hypothetical protein
MSKHTEGPWSIDKGHMILGGNGMRVAYADLMSPDDEALILAAPDLLEALEALIEDHLFYIEGDKTAQMNVTVEAYESARAAIKKARGESC